MSRTVLAAVMPAPHVPVEIREFAEPGLPPGGALLRTALSEVCGTDVHLWHGRLAGVPYPIIPGHVTTGTLDAVRGALTGVEGHPLREGDRVAFFDVHRTCGRCLACTVHRTPTRCPSRRVYGITDSATEGLFGGWSQMVYLEPGVVVARLPEGVSFEAYIGADVVIEAAGSARAFEEGVRLARNGGAYVIAGHYTNVGDSTINAHEHINRKHLDIRGCWGSEVGHFLRALRALERYHHEIPWHLIGAQTFGLGRINEALAVAGALTIPKALVDPWRAV